MTTFDDPALVWVFTRGDGSQILVRFGMSGPEVAERPSKWVSWGPPLYPEPL